MTAEKLLREVDHLILLLSGNSEPGAQFLRGAQGVAFLRRCRRQRLSGTLEPLVRSAPAISERVRGGFALDRHRQCLQVSRYLLELDRVTGRLADEGIPYRLLKGPAMAARFFGSADLKPVGDMDVLVPRQQFLRAAGIVSGLGYRRRDGLPLGLLLSFEHAVEYRSPEGVIDLHHALAVHPALRLDTLAPWQDPAWVKIGGRRHPMLPDAQSLLALLLGIHRDIGLSRLSLRPFVDLWMMLQHVDGRMDWEAFVAAGARDGCWRPCERVLAAFLTLFQGRERFPGAAACVRSRPARAQVAELFDRRRWARNKWWFWRSLDLPLHRSFAFWLIGLPVRLAAFGRG